MCPALDQPLGFEFIRATSRLGTVPRAAANACWLIAGVAARIRKIPACAGARFTSARRSAKFAAAWAPTCASRKAAPGPLLGVEQSFSSVRSRFIESIVASFNDFVIE